LDGDPCNGSTIQQEWYGVSCTPEDDM
jgi:hypothetical protein